jgi:hypothetical protein
MTTTNIRAASLSLFPARPGDLGLAADGENPIGADGEVIFVENQPATASW